MIYQIHHQNTKNPSETVFLAQREISDRGEMAMLINEVMDTVVLPEGWQWMVCNEHSEYFKEGV